MPKREPPATGTLYLVGTPIGNLEDLTLRAIRILKQVSCVAAEDTRRTRALLTHLGITQKSLCSINANSSKAQLERLIESLCRGNDVALVTDAGMPCISDPGADLVSAALESSLEVVCIPGPSAVTAAAALSGLVNGPFSFFGFLARKGQRRQAELSSIQGSSLPVIVFESPLRAAKTLQDLSRLMPERQAALCREITKLHEEVLRGTLGELAQSTTGLRGEVTLVIEGGALEEQPPISDAALDSTISDLLAAGNSTRDVSQTLAEQTGLSKKALYARVQAVKDRRTPG